MNEGRPKVLELLNEALKNELTATNQYWLHYRLLDNWGVKKLAEFERSELIDEMKHADRLAERILFLDGLPNFQMLGRLHIGENVEEILRADLELEMEALSQLRGAIAHCEKVQDYVSRDLFSDILDNEEEHVDTLEKQFEMIARMGLQNYIQLQSEPAEGLDPAETLVAGLAPEAAGRGARVTSGLVAFSNSSMVSLNSRRSSTTSGTSSSGKRWVSMHSRAVVSISSAIFGQRLGAELARFALERVRREDQRGGVLLAHRLFDLGDRFGAVFPEIAQDADEAGPELGPALLEMRPIDDVPSLVGSHACSS